MIRVRCLLGVIDLKMAKNGWTCDWRLLCWYIVMFINSHEKCFEDSPGSSDRLSRLGERRKDKLYETIVSCALSWLCIIKNKALFSKWNLTYPRVYKIHVFGNGGGDKIRLGKKWGSLELYTTVNVSKSQKRLHIPPSNFSTIQLLQMCNRFYIGL